MTYKTFFGRNQSLMCRERPIGIVFDLNNGKYLLQLQTENQVNTFYGYCERCNDGCLLCAKS